MKRKDIVMPARPGRSLPSMFLLVVAALIIGAGAMYIYQEQKKETFSMKLPGGSEITVEKDQ